MDVEVRENWCQESLLQLQTPVADKARFTGGRLSINASGVIIVYQLQSAINNHFL